MNKFILFAFIITTVFTQAQNVGIGTNNPDPSAKLQIDANNAGILIPRVNITSVADATTVPSPATGLMVWNTGVSFGTAGFYFNSGTTIAPNWIRILDSASSVNDADADPNNEIQDLSISGNTLSLSGDATTVDLSSFKDHDWYEEGQTRGADNIGDNIFTQGDVAIGQISATEKLDVNGNIRASGIVYWGGNDSRTESRADAGLQGDSGAKSGYYETSVPAPATSWPAGATSWWHLLDLRHSNPGNNYAMQFSGSFFNQELYFRKTNNNASTPWARVLTSNEINGTTNYVSKFTGPNALGNSQIFDNGTNVGIGTAGPYTKLHVDGDIYNNNGIIATHSTTTDLSTSTNIDHMWHDDVDNAWHLVSDDAYKAVGNTELYVNEVHMPGNVAFVVDRTYRTLNNANVGYRTVGNATNNLAVKTGDVVVINVTFKFLWTGGSGGDHPYFGIRINGACGTITDNDSRKHGTADDVPRGQEQSLSYQYVWVATCNGNVTFNLYCDNNSDADDIAGFADICIVAQKF